MAKYIAAIDQGTTSTRCMIFDHQAGLVAAAQAEHRQIYPHPGWVEHDPREIWLRVQEVVSGALQQRGLKGTDIAAIGVTNQRETVVIWDRLTGEPLCNAIVWQDTRTRDICAQLVANGVANILQERTGLPLATYFSGPKIRWTVEHLPAVAKMMEYGEALCGTIDSWIIWNLTGGIDGGLHITDVTNASRTMLMDLATLQWDADVLRLMRVPERSLPRICSSSEVYGTARGLLQDVPVAGVLGDQQAALVGQACFTPGEVKNTYGTGCFMLLHTGDQPVASQAGLVTTVAYQMGPARVQYALEGSIAVAGTLVQWLRDNLGLIKSSADIEALARTVSDNGGLFFVPAFSGLFAPYWRNDARGVMVGLTSYINKGHLARAALEAVAFQTREVLDAMNADAAIPLSTLKVDGGMVNNELLMQFQADILGVPVIRPIFTETTALGAAYAAGLGVGFWRNRDELCANWRKEKEWYPAMAVDKREKLYADWKRAVTRAFGWVV